MNFARVPPEYAFSARPLEVRNTQDRTRSKIQRHTFGERGLAVTDQQDRGGAFFEPSLCQRAGADAILTYFAKDIATSLANK